MIWINGEILEIDTHTLFNYVRNLPEPISDEIVSFNSRTANLMITYTDWGDLIAKHLWILIIEICRNCEIILQENRETTSKHTKIIILKNIIYDLQRLAMAVKNSKIAFWAISATDIHTVEKQWFAINSSDSIMLQLPHIKIELMAYAEAERAFRKISLREIMILNKRYKHY